MRVAIVTECFLPEMNGVTNSVMQVTEQLRNNGHEVLVVAPGEGPRRYQGARVVRTRAVAHPAYKTLPVGLPTTELGTTLAQWKPDVVHLAGPIAFGAYASRVTRQLNLPTVAIYQTDWAGFLGQYGLGMTGPAVWRWLAGVHRRAALTLAPSSAAVADLQRAHIPNVERWGRGVDADRFHPGRMNAQLRQQLAPNGEVIVGYVGRLAREKRVDMMAAVSDVPGVQVVIVGDGPDRARLERLLPRAKFVGFQSGEALAEHYASLDVFVHTGAHDTFCQAVQEAMASGVPVAAPSAGGPADLVRHGRSGWLWDPDDDLSLRWAVDDLAGDPVRRKQMGAYGRQLAEGRTWPVLVGQLVRHYEKVRQRDQQEVAA